MIIYQKSSCVDTVYSVDPDIIVLMLCCLCFYMWHYFFFVLLCNDNKGIQFYITLFHINMETSGWNIFIFVSPFMKVK